MASLYAVLGIESSATAEEVRGAFRQKALENHPDKGGQKSAFQAILAAFQVLSDASRKAKYDSCMGFSGLAHSRLSSMGSTKKRRHVPTSHSQTGRFRDGLDHECKKADKPAHIAREAKAARIASDQIPRRPSDGSNGSSFLFERFEDRILNKVAHFLRSAIIEERRRLLQKCFSHQQRKQLEHWMLVNRTRKSADAALTLQQCKDSASCESYGDSESSSAATLGDDDCRFTEDNFTSRAICDGLLTTSNDFNTGYSQDSSADRFDSDLAQVAPNGFFMSGIATHKFSRGRQVRYSAYVNVQFVRLRSLTYLDLSQAIDAHLAFTAVREWTRNAEDCFEQSLTEALHSILPKHGLTSEKDVDILIIIPAHVWIGCSLPSLYFRGAQLDEALKCWRRLVDARGPLHRGTPLSFYCSEEYQSRWSKLRTAFIDIAHSCQRNSAELGQRLDELEKGRLPIIERYTERWNRSRMEAEERNQRLVILLEFAASRRELNRERRAMKQEERLSHHAFRGSRGTRGRLGVHESLETNIQKLAQRWTRFQRLQFDKMAKLAAKQKKSDLKKEQLRSKIAREQRWKWMNRPGITMEDLLHSVPSSRGSKFI